MPVSEHEWEQFVSRHPAATVFHRVAWMDVLRQSYGGRPLYLLLGDTGGEGATCGGIPLLEIHSPFTGRRAVSLPFTDECAPLFDTDSDWETALDDLVELGRKRQWRFVEFRGNAEQLGCKPVALRFYGHTLGLSGGPDACFRRLKSEFRTAVRKARREGVLVRFGTDLQAIRDYYRLHCLTRKTHGLPPQPFKFFRTLHRQLIAQGKGRVALAEVAGRTVSGAVFLEDGDTALYKFGASDPDFRGLRPANLVMWEAIRAYAEQGFARLDMGRTSLDNEGLRRFKLGWGCEERVISYGRLALPEAHWVEAADQTSGWHVAVFSRLPIPLLRLAGRILYRHIA